MTPEFSRRYPLDSLGSAPHSVSIEAEGNEHAAVADRFGLIALERLAATATLVRGAGGVTAKGRLEAEVVQSCVVTGEPVHATLDEPFELRFVEAMSDAPEVELDADDLDVVEHDGVAVDLGEAVAQTLGLALDPFPRAAVAGDEGQRWQAGPDAGPFAGLKDMLKE